MDEYGRGEGALIIHVVEGLGVPDQDEGGRHCDGKRAKKLQRRNER